MGRAQHGRLWDVITRTTHLGCHPRRISLLVHVGLRTGSPTAHMRPGTGRRSGAYRKLLPTVKLFRCRKPGPRAGPIDVSIDCATTHIDIVVLLRMNYIQLVRPTDVYFQSGRGDEVRPSVTCCPVISSLPLNLRVARAIFTSRTGAEALKDSLQAATPRVGRRLEALEFAKRA